LVIYLNCMMMHGLINLKFKKFWQVFDTTITFLFTTWGQIAFFQTSNNAVHVKGEQYKSAAASLEKEQPHTNSTTEIQRNETGYSQNVCIKYSNEMYSR
jgi:hypothetical protein